MKEILVNETIAWYGITANKIREDFLSAKNEDIKLVIDCPGGDCFEGISIYNFIRDFARNHKNKITTYIQGMAASAASWIALAANSVNPENKIICEDNSIFMIHNCWGVAIGDYREMEKSAEFSKRIDALIIQMLSNKSKKNISEIKNLMDAETWYFGNEIFENGFCDEIISTGKTSSGDIEIEEAVNVFKNCQNKFKNEVEKNTKAYKENFEKSFFAFNLICEKSDFSDSNNSSEKSESKEAKMTVDEFKSKEPKLFDEIFNQGKSIATATEKKRVSDLLGKFKKAGNVNAAMPFIEGGKSITDEEVIDALLDCQLKAKGKSDRIEDEPPAFNPPATPKDVEDEATKVFKNAFGVK